MYGFYNVKYKKIKIVVLFDVKYNIIWVNNAIDNH